jgi:hypothetical protein
MIGWFKVETIKRFNVRPILVTWLASVLVLTAIWAFAFHNIYLRDEPRIAASRWVFQNVHGPINVEIQTDDSIYSQPLPFPRNGYVQAGRPYTTTFVAQTNGVLDKVTLGHAINRLALSSTLKVTLSDTLMQFPARSLATGSLTSDFAAENDPRGNSQS